MGWDTPPRSDTAYWEPKADILFEVLKQRGPLNLASIKTAMTRKGFKISTTVNVLSYLSLTNRVEFTYELRQWRVV